MKYVIIVSISMFFFSCKKCKDNFSVVSLPETKWDLYYKNNSTFTFYAKSLIYFKENKSIDNYRNFDTVTGNWEVNENIVSINFDSGDKYSGEVFTDDSISGTLTASGYNGVWYAKKR